jgi:hypothetical protein
VRAPGDGGKYTVWDCTKGALPNILGNGRRYPAWVFPKTFPLVFENGCDGHVLIVIHFGEGLIFITLMQ